MTDKLDSRARKVFEKAYYPKFLASVDESGVPNVVPVLTLRAADESTLIFARFMVWKTARNLESTGRLTVACVGPGRHIWSVRGDFVEFVKSGPYLELFNETFLFRYNAYAGVDQVGVIRVREALDPAPVRWVRTIARQRSVARAAAKASSNDGAGPMPVQVVRQFERKTALKYIAHTSEDGYPVPRPVLAMFPAGRSALAFCDLTGAAMRIGAKVAVCVFNRDVIAYQVKGYYAGARKFGSKNFDAIDVDEVFTASPPLPGKQITPKM